MTLGDFFKRFKDEDMSRRIMLLLPNIDEFDDYELEFKDISLSLPVVKINV